jgi:hypothetical protein
MIFVRKQDGTSFVDIKIQTTSNKRLYSTRSPERSFSGVCKSEADTQSASDWWSRRGQDNNRQSNVQRDRLRLHDSQWL